MVEPLCVLFNPDCSKCREVRQILEDRKEPATFIHYLEDVPSRAELVATVRKLGLRSPRGMMRVNEPVYRELGLEDAHDEQLIAAMVENPVLIERPILIRGERAVIARPPSKALDLLEP